MTSRPPDLATARRITAEELFAHPEWGRCELVNGELIHMSPAGAEHGDIGAAILAALFYHVMQNKSGKVYNSDTGFFLRRDPDTVRSPDVSYVALSRLPDARSPKGYLECAPDLAVEVVSPSDSFTEVSSKAQEYIAAGVRLVWVVDPESRRAYAFRPNADVQSLAEDGALDGKDVLPGFSLPLSQVFAR